MIIKLKDIPSPRPHKISAPGTAAALGYDLMNISWSNGDAHKESAYAIGLKEGNVILYTEVVSIGVRNAAFLMAKEVYRNAITAGAVSVIILHNHPSGELKPSADDLMVSDLLARAGWILDIKLLDHIIIGNPSTKRPPRTLPNDANDPPWYYSFNDNHMLDIEQVKERGTDTPLKQC